MTRLVPTACAFAVSFLTLVSLTGPAAAWRNDGTPEMNNLLMEAAIQAYIDGRAPASSLVMPPEEAQPYRRFRDLAPTSIVMKMDMEPLHRRVREICRRDAALRGRARHALAPSSKP